MNYYIRRWNYINRHWVRPLLELIVYMGGIVLTLYILWVIVSIVILLDPGNPYNM